MKALTYLGPNKVEVREHTLGELQDGYARIRVKYCGVCGSDMGIYHGTHPRAQAPLILGHEFIGTITEIKNGSGRFSVGQRILLYPQISCGTCYACRHDMIFACQTINYFGIDRPGGMAEYADIPEEYLIALPDGISDVAASVVEPLAVTLHAIKKADIAPNSNVLIIGAGPIGILLAIGLQQHGTDNIWFSEVNKANAQKCQELGFSAINPMEEDLVTRCIQITKGDGMDCVFECSGSPAVTETMTQLCRIGGTICIVSTHKKPSAVMLRDVMFKELCMIGARGYSYSEYVDTVDFARKIGKRLEDAVSHIIPLTDAENVFELILDSNTPTTKVLIDCLIDTKTTNK